MTIAIRGGTGLLLFSCLLGFVLVAYGNRQVALGQPPEMFGSAGVMKFPHGVPMHAIQFLPLLTWFLHKLKVPENDRIRAVAGALGSVLAFTIFSLLQTFTGRARFEFWWMSGLVLFGSVALLLVPVCIGISHVKRGLCRDRPSV
jgi:hypothetical protein